MVKETEKETGMERAKAVTKPVKAYTGATQRVAFFMCAHQIKT
jgi:hypothetical protein